eukprot:m.112783 g.112783  ORF g.112783 m.112783 type:complete len:205 (+) comp17041_c0_seq2:188-802(+)
MSAQSSSITALISSAIAAGGVQGYIAISVIGNMIPAPGLSSVLCVTAGVYYGTLWGSVYNLISAVLGAVLALAACRMFLRPVIMRALSSYEAKLNSLNKAMAADGVSIVLLLRLSPMFPFPLTTLLLSLTTIDQFSHMWTTAVGLIPGTVAFVYGGAAGADMASGEMGWGNTIVTVIGVIASVVATRKIGKIASQALEKAETSD